MAALLALRERVDGACRRADRDPDGVELFAVSKFHSVDRIEALLATGHRCFAESRVQEVEAKWPPLRQRYPDVRLHLVGSLQRNKVARAVALFDAIESVDRESLATAIAYQCARQGRRPECLVQVNIGEEEQKGGVPPAAADAFIERCRDVHGLNVRGVMGVPPDEVDPRPYFDLLRDLADRHRLPVVSMGMTADHEVAVAAGSTRLRIGRALFGERAR